MAFTRSGVLSGRVANARFVVEATAPQATLDSMAMNATSLTMPLRRCNRQAYGNCLIQQSLGETSGIGWVNRCHLRSVRLQADLFRESGSARGLPFPFTACIRSPQSMQTMREVEQNVNALWTDARGIRGVGT